MLLCYYPSRAFWLQGEGLENGLGIFHLGIRNSAEFRDWELYDVSARLETRWGPRIQKRVYFVIML